jgi:hypothetical protein
LGQKNQLIAMLNLSHKTITAGKDSHQDNTWIFCPFSSTLETVTVL